MIKNNFYKFNGYVVNLVYDQSLIKKVVYKCYLTIIDVKHVLKFKVYIYCLKYI